MKGKTQFPHSVELVEGEAVDDEGAAVPDVVAVVEGVGNPSLHVADSSPSAAKANLFSVMTAALLETPVTPVGVPVDG